MKNKLIEAAIFIKNWCATRGVYDEKENDEHCANQAKSVFGILKAV